MVAFLEKSTSSEGFHQVIDFLTRSHICYALTKKPDVCVSFIKQFWRSAEVTTADNEKVKIIATIDGHSMTITEASLRRHLKLDDHDGLSSIPNSEIFEQLALMGYHTDSDKLTFQKGAFSPQWRFIQICLDMQRHQLQHHTRTYPVPSLSMKVFNNMKRPTKGYSGQEVALFPTMLIVPAPFTSPSRITSSPSHSPKPSHTPDVSQPSPTQPSPRAEHHLPTPNESPLHAVHSHGSDEGSLKLTKLTVLVTKLSDRIGVLEDDLRKTKKTYSSAFTKLILRVNKLEARVKIGESRQRAKVVLSEDDKDIADDSFKHGRKLSDAEQESSKKGQSEVSTAGAKQGTASEVPIVSTVEVNLSTAGGTVTYTRRSEEKRTRKDKGKAIMTESEPKKKSKKELEQEKLSFAEAIRFQEQMDEEQRAQITRDEEIARQ
ncbi:hypothetical protein Tco_1541901 [Tanacetum coccineum]